MVTVGGDLLYGWSVSPRAVFLQRRSSELMDNEELTVRAPSLPPSYSSLLPATCDITSLSQKLWSTLEEQHTPPDLGNDEQVVNWLSFGRCWSSLCVCVCVCVCCLCVCTDD